MITITWGAYLLMHGIFLVAKYGLPPRWPLACCPSRRAIVSHCRGTGVPVANQIPKYDSLGIAQVMGPLGSGPAVGVGYPGVLRYDPNHRAEFGGLCHT